VAVGRQFVYSTFFARLQRTAGPHYGKLAGAANLCVAAAGALQPGLVALSSQHHGQQSFVAVNGLFLLLTAGLLSQPMRCWQDKTGPGEQGSAAAARLPQVADEEAGGRLATLRVNLLPTDGL